MSSRASEYKIHVVKAGTVPGRKNFLQTSLFRLSTE